MALRKLVSLAAVLPVAVVVTFAAGGCQPSREALPNPMPITAAAYDPVYEAAAEVLRGAGFRLVVRDYRFGELVTAPRGSPTAVEIWHGDNTTLGQAMLSTLSDVRRQVRVELEPGERDQTEVSQDRWDYGIRLEVTMQRRRLPVRRLNGAVGRRMFSQLNAVPTEWAARGIEASYWETIGRDRHLEQRLLRRIADRAELEPVGEPASPGTSTPAPAAAGDVRSYKENREDE